MSSLLEPYTEVDVEKFGYFPDATLYGQILLRIRNASAVRSKYEKQWRINLKLYEGDQKPANISGTGRHKWMQANRIRNAVETHVAVITETPARFNFQSVELNEPALWYLTPDAIEKLSPVGEYRSGPYTKIQAEQLMASVTVPQPTGELDMTTDPDTGIVDAQLQQQPVPVLNDDDFIVIDDKLCAEAINLVINTMWRWDHCDNTVRDNIRAATVDGHSDLLVQWNAIKFRVELIQLRPESCWIDPYADSPQHRCDYFIIDEKISISEAHRRYPDIPMDVLKTLSNRMTQTPASTYGDYETDRYGNDIFTNDGMLRMLTQWVRDTQVDVHEDEAVRTGQVQTDTPFVDEKDELGVYPFAVNGEPTAPGADNWPVKMAVKQTIMLGDIVMFDDETEFADIPVSRNKNIPRLYTAYGIGLPESMQKLQELYNRLYSIMYNHAKYFQSPETAMAASVAKALKDSLQDLYSRADRYIIIPDNILNRFGGDPSKVISYMTPPQLNSSYFDLMRMVGEELDRLAGLADVMRGQAKSSWSGELFEQAINAARGPIGLVARNTASMLQHVGMIMSRLVIDYLPLEEWKKHTSKYSEEILTVMRSRLKQMEFDVKVEVSGAGTKEKRRSDLANLYATAPMLQQSPTFTKALMEEFDVSDVEKIQEEISQALTQNNQQQQIP